MTVENMARITKTETCLAKLPEASKSYLKQFSRTAELCASENVKRTNRGIIGGYLRALVHVGIINEVECRVLHIYYTLNI